MSSIELFRDHVDRHIGMARAPNFLHVPLDLVTDRTLHVSWARVKTFFTGIRCGWCGRDRNESMVGRECKVVS